MQTFYKNTFMILVLLVFSSAFTSMYSQVQYIVNTVSDGNTGSLNQGSLRYVLDRARNHVDPIATIKFASSINTITLGSDIQLWRTNGGTLVIDGETGRLTKVKLQGIGSKSTDGFTLKSEGAITITGFHFENFSHAITVDYDMANLSTIQNNIFTRNAVGITQVLNSADCRINGNRIGTDLQLNPNLGNDINILFSVAGSYNNISNNYICSATGNAIQGLLSTKGVILLQNNNIGSSFNNLGNNGFAVNISGGHTYLKNNTISANKGGIQITGAGTAELSQNFLSCNTITAPIFSSALPYKIPIIDTLQYLQNGTVYISGRSQAFNDVIEIYTTDALCSSSICQGDYKAMATTNTSLKWQATFNAGSGAKIFVSASIPRYDPVIEGSSVNGISSLFTSCQIPQCPAVDVNFQAVSPVSCYDGNDGKASLTITPVGAGGQYEYFITQTDVTPNVSTTPKTIVLTDTFRTLTSGKFKVTVRNKLTTCLYTSSNEITITQPTIPLLPKACGQTKPTSSPVATDGEAEVKAFGGYPPYKLTYRKDTGPTITFPTTSDSLFILKNLGVGNYFFTITDSRNGPCSAMCNFSITPPNCSALKVSIVSQTNVKCFDGNTGSVKIKYADILSNFPLILKLSNGDSTVINSFSSDSTFTFSNLKKGNYIITLYNKYSCTPATNFFTIIEPSKLDINCDAVFPAQKIGEASGSVQLTIRNGGPPPYRIAITGSKDTNEIIPSLMVQKTVDKLKAGAYVAQVTDGNGCIDTCQFIIKDPICNIAIAKTVTNVSCYGQANGKIVTKITGAKPPLILKWSNNATTDSIVGLLLGLYKVTVTDSIGCIKIDSATVTQPTPLKVDTVVRHLTQVGLNTGRIVLNVSGGTPTYTVGILGQTATGTPPQYIYDNLAKGTYKYTVTDVKNCTLTDSVVIKEPNCTLQVIATPTDVLCNGDATGKINTTVTNANGRTSYTWTGTMPIANNTPNPTNLLRGAYTVVVKDTQNCSATANVTVNEPSKLSSTNTPITTSGIGLSTGEIRIKVKGGKPTYTLSLSLGTGTVTPISTDSFVIKNLLKGDYRYVITDANGCKDSINVTINDPSCNGLTIKEVKIDSIKCFNDKNGRITLTVTGGTRPYKYAWNPTISTDSVVSNLGAGSYLVTVTDNVNCTTKQTINISQPDSLQSTATPQSVLLPNGNDGKITIVVKGGTRPYSITSVEASTRINDSTFVIANLEKGTYSYTIRDINGCQTTKSVDVNGSDCVLQITATPTDVLCFGDATGKINTTISGANGTVGYTWTGTTPIANNIPNPINLLRGSYTVIVKDGQNCSDTATVTVAEPIKLSSTNTPIDTRGIGQSTGEIRIKVAGGTPIYSVQLSLGTGIVSFVPTDSFYIKALAKGDYRYVVTDANGCKDSTNVTINDPDCNGLTINKIEIDSIKCFNDKNGRITLTVTGGTRPYKYAWNPTISTDSVVSNLGAGSYLVTVTDNVNCTTRQTINISQPDSLQSTATPQDVLLPNGNDGKITIVVKGGTRPYSITSAEVSSRVNDSTFVIANLKKGTYSYTIRDINGCQITKTVIVNGSDCVLQITATPTDVLCFGDATGKINTTVSGANGTVSYAWTGTTSIANNIQNPINLRRGSYTVIVKDEQNCSDTATVTVNEPIKLSSTDTVINVTVVGQSTGEIRIKVTGGTPTYTVSLSPITGTISRSGIDSFYFKNLPKGNYQYIVADANGCKDTTTVSIKDPDCPMSSTLSISKPISCFGLSDGAIDLTVQHAQTPQYNWNGGLGTVQNPINVKAGTYSVTITDTNGCFEIKQITVTEPPQIKATLLGDTAICAGRTAKLRFVVTGATNFTLVFSNGTTNTTVATTETIVAPTTTTNYNLVRIQSGTCVGVVEGTAKVQVTNLQTLTGFKAEKDTVCNGLELALSVTPSVVSDVQYIWQTPTGVFATQAPNLLIPNSRAINSGLYTVQVLSNGCSSEKTAPIRITIVNIATEQASAGNDTTECGGTTINLSAKAIQGQNVVGLWTALDGGTIASPSLRNSAVYNLKAGSNRFVWTLLDRFCGKLSPDTVSIFVASKPVLTDAEFRLEGTVSSILINLTELIKDTANVKVTDKIVSTINGSAKIQDKWFLSFDRSTALEAQRIEIPYEVCSTTCPTLCETSRLFINISALEEKVKFPSAIIFIPGTTEPSVRFPGIELIKNNECLIVDRWGVPVFGPAPYKNDSPNNAWDATKKGKPLPPGAYFYYITDKDKIPPAPFSGIIYLLEGQ